MISTLNDLVEKRWSIFDRLGEDLQQIAMFIVVDQDAQFLKRIEVLSDLDRRFGEFLAQRGVVGLWHAQELHTTKTQVVDSFDDVLRAQGDVLHASTAVEFDVLLNLAFPQARGRLVDWHLHDFVVIGNDSGTKRAVLCAHHFVVD